MLALKWDTPTAKGFADLLDLIPVAALESPRRSILPLVDSRRHPTEVLQKLRDAVSLGLLDATVLTFEHLVRVQEGRGKPLYTALMVHCPGASVAIEAKYTDPRYEVVVEWLGESTESGEPQPIRRREPDRPAHHPCWGCTYVLPPRPPGPPVSQG